MNELTFSLAATIVIIFLTWLVNDVIPQIRYNRKLDKAARLAEESRRRYEETKANEITVELTPPDWGPGPEAYGWVENRY